MRNRRLTRVALVGALALAGVVGFGPRGQHPAEAACVSAEAYYQLNGGGNSYVFGPKRCVANTPWTECASTGPVAGGLPGKVVVGTQVWVTCPVAR